MTSVSNLDPRAELIVGVQQLSCFAAEKWCEYKDKKRWQRLYDLLHSHADNAASRWEFIKKGCDRITKRWAMQLGNSGRPSIFCDDVAVNLFAQVAVHRVIDYFLSDNTEWEIAPSMFDVSD
jgi:hypothetical protein